MPRYVAQTGGSLSIPALDFTFEMGEDASALAYAASVLQAIGQSNVIKSLTVWRNNGQHVVGTVFLKMPAAVITPALEPST